MVFLDHSIILNLNSKTGGFAGGFLTLGLSVLIAFNLKKYIYLNFGRPDFSGFESL